MKMDAVLLFFICISSLRTTFAQLNVTVEPPAITLLEGQTFNAMCNISVPITSCGWYFNGSSEPIVLEPKPGGNLVKGIHYSGQGLEYGECGITIRNVTEEHNKILICYLSPKNESYGKNETKSVNLVVAKAPRAPKIKIIRIDHMIKKNSPDTFVENQTIEVECTVKFGRPAAKILWLIGSEPIKDNLTATEIYDLEPEYNGQKEVRQTLTRQLKYLDNEEHLICLVEHIALKPSALRNRKFKLNVQFPPKSGIVEQRNNMIGQPGEIVVTFQANPEPKTQWLENGVKIFEGDMYSTDLEGTGHATWQAVLYIRAIRAEDVEKNYTLIARNEFGKAEYKAKILAYHCSDVKTSSTSSSGISVCPTCPTCTTYSPDHKYCSTPSPDPTPYPTPSLDFKACPPPSVDVTAWSIAGTAVVILFIILVRPKLIKFISNRRSRSAAPVPTVRYKLRKNVRDAEEDKFY